MGQHGNQIYEKERSERLTASLFGKVCKRRPQTSCHNLVKECLYKNFTTTEDMIYGINNEKYIREQFSKMYCKDVKPCGLFIDKNHHFLGASPDGRKFSTYF